MAEARGIPHLKRQAAPAAEEAGHRHLKSHCWETPTPKPESKPQVWVLLPREGRQHSQWQPWVKVGLSAEQRHTFWCQLRFLDGLVKLNEIRCTNHLSCCKKIPARLVQQFRRALQPPLRSRSVSSSSKGSWGESALQPQACCEQNPLSCGRTGDILNWCLSSPLVSKPNHFYE